MYIIIKNTEILQAGQDEYTDIEAGTEQIEIDNSMWKGKRKFEIKWDGKKIVDKTVKEVQDYYDIAKNKKIVELKEKIYVRQGINEDYTEFQNELEGLEND